MKAKISDSFIDRTPESQLNRSNFFDLKYECNNDNKLLWENKKLLGLNGRLQYNTLISLLPAYLEGSVNFSQSLKSDNVGIAQSLAR